MRAPISPHPKFRRIDPVHPDVTLLKEAAAVLKRGGLVVFPTETFYGLGADPFSITAIHRIFKTKGRGEENPILLLIGRREDVRLLVSEIPAVAERLMNAFWPGPLTLLFKAAPSIPRELTAGTGKIGIRFPDHLLVRALIQQFGKPITGTSANPSGKPPVTDPSQLPERFLEQMDLILDAGPTPGGSPSTVMDGTTTPPRIIREGRIPHLDILREA